MLLEVWKGYPEHYFYAIGHMAEAEDECVVDFPGLSAFIRDLRLQLQIDAKFAERIPWKTIFANVQWIHLFAGVPMI